MNVYSCPGYDRIRAEVWYYPTNAQEDIFGSYACNQAGFLDGRGLGGHRVLASVGPTRESEIACPSDMVGMADSIIWGGGGFQTLDGVTTYYRSADSDYDRAVLYGVPSTPKVPWITRDAANAMRRRHSWRWNVGFCDGHTENLLTKQLFDWGNPVVAQRWNQDHQAHNEWWPNISPP